VTDAWLAGINAAVHELADEGGLIDQLRELLAERGRTPEIVVRGVPGSRPPWDAHVAGVHMSIHAWAREAEADLGTYVHGSYGRTAGGSDAVTRWCLQMVLVYCESGAVPDRDVQRVARHIGTLLRAAQGVPGIDLAPAPAATLRQPCPYCHEGALTAATDGSTEIWCANDVCTDPTTGERPRWPKSRWPFLLARLAQGGAA
jgi:hypothetical protein